MSFGLYAVSFACICMFFSCLMRSIKCQAELLLQVHLIDLLMIPWIFWFCTHCIFPQCSGLIDQILDGITSISYYNDEFGSLAHQFGLDRFKSDIIPPYHIYLNFISYSLKFDFFQRSRPTDWQLSTIFWTIIEARL